MLRRSELAQRRQVYEIVQQALRLSGSSRDKFIHRQCGNDGAVYEEVMRRLASCRGMHNRRGRDLDLEAEYELLDEIGRGGSGVVYRARQRSLQRSVAIKMLRAGQFASETEIHRFLVEAEAAAQLDHPGIVPIYEIGRYHGQPCLAMGLIEGVSLAEKVKDGPLASHDAARLTMTVAETIGFAHDHGVIHRDLKPANIRITAGGRPIVTDFGLAKQVAGNRELTMTGEVLGTPGYMSPEQVRGDPQSVGPAADVYGLGAILYTLLSGRPPFQSSNPTETLKQVLDDEPVPVCRLNAAVERDLETICDRCLQKEPCRRYVSAMDLAADLQRFLNHKPILARRAGRLRRGWMWCRRNPVAAIFCVVVTVLLVLVGGVREVGHRNTTAALDQAKRHLYFADMHRAREALEDSDIDRVDAILHRWVPESHEDDFRGWEWYYLLGQCHRDILTINGGHVTVHHVVWSPDGHSLASATPASIRLHDAKTGALKLIVHGHSTVVWAPDGGRFAYATSEGSFVVRSFATDDEPVRFSGHSAVVRSLAWNAQGTRIASASEDNSVKLWDAETGDLLSTLNGHDDWVFDVAWSVDGQSMASAAKNGVVKIWDPTTGIETRSFRAHHGAVSSIRWSPDMQSLATAGIDGAVKIWSMATGRTVRILAGHSRPVMSVAWSPDGKRLASAGADQSIIVWDASGGRRSVTLRGHRQSVESIAWSPNGERLASAGADGAVKLWLVSDPDLSDVKLGASYTLSSDWKLATYEQIDGRLGVRNAHSGEVICSLDAEVNDTNCLAWNPHKRQVAGGRHDGMVHLWDVELGSEVCALDSHHDNVHCLAWSPDGATLATAGTDQTIRLWDVTTQRQRRVLRGHTASVRAVCWSADQRRLASASVDGTIKLWNPQDGGMQVSVRGHTSPILCLGFDATGQRLASGSANGEVRIWNTLSGKELLMLRGHTKRVFSVAWHPNGQRLASKSRDGSIKVWDTQTGQVAVTLYLYSDNTAPITWSPDGHRLGSGSVWDASGAYSQTQGPHKLMPPITDQRGKYLHEPFSDDFDDGLLDETLWKVGRPSVTESDGYVALRNRGYLVSVGQFPDGLSLAFDWRWIDSIHDPLYSDQLTVVLRTSGQPRVRRAYECTDGVVVNLDPWSGTIAVTHFPDNVSIDETVSDSLSFPPNVWHRIRIVDDSESISVYVEKKQEPRLRFALKNRSSAHHFAIYNREHVAGPHESHLDNVQVGVIR